MDKQALIALLERVEKATGPDRELDCRISHHFDRRGIWYGAAEDSGWAPAETVDGWDDTKWHEVGQDYVSSLVQQFTRSIDAALALVERVLPSALWHVNRPADWTGKIKKRKGEPLPAFEGYVSLGTIGATDYVSGSSMGHNPSLAILAALFKALISKAEKIAA